MILASLISIFERDLKKLILEIELYNNEKNIWRTEHSIANSAGNLTLHLIGNLNSFIGTALGKTGYVRNRLLEFSEKDVPRVILIQKINETIGVVKNTLSALPPNELDNDYPIMVFKEKMSTEYFLIHLTTHLAYHLGQINYHRRLIDV